MNEAAQHAIDRIRVITEGFKWGISREGALRSIEVIMRDYETELVEEQRRMDLAFLGEAAHA